MCKRLLGSLNEQKVFSEQNADFPPLSYSNFSKSCSSVSMSLLYATACNSLSDNVILSSKHLPNSSNELLSMVSGVSCGKFVRNQMSISCKSFAHDLVFSVSTKSNHHLVCKSVISSETVPVNVLFASAHERVNAVKSVSCNLRVSSLAKPMFIYLNTVRSLNVCNAVKSLSSAHHTGRVFPVTHDVLSNHRQSFYPKINVLWSSRTKSSLSYSTSNPRSLNLRHIALSAKFCIFFMMLFNVILLNQSIKIF